LQEQIEDGFWGEKSEQEQQGAKDKSRNWLLPQGEQKQRETLVRDFRRGKVEMKAGAMRALAMGWRRMPQVASPDEHEKRQAAESEAKAGDEEGGGQGTWGSNQTKMTPSTKKEPEQHRWRACCVRGERE
jgi:hypothetical protein